MNDVGTRDEDGGYENELGQILAGAGRPPSRLTVRHVTVEVEWAQDGETPPGQAREKWRDAGRPRVSQPPPAAVPAAGAQPAGAPAEDQPDGPDAHYLCSPTVGTFYRAPEPGAPPFVSEGSVVCEGQQVAIIEVMKLMIPVEADRAGRVAEVLQPDAASVEHGERLFIITAGV
jgi:acetyl-CoA carboxylase biotin carboxyl carrier protein